MCKGQCDAGVLCVRGNGDDVCKGLCDAGVLCVRDSVMLVCCV